VVVEHLSYRDGDIFHMEPPICTNWATPIDKPVVSILPRQGYNTKGYFYVTGTGSCCIQIASSYVVSIDDDPCITDIKHAPDMPTTITNKVGSTCVGVFGLCISPDHKVVVIQKKQGGKWFIPGGLVDQKDVSLSKKTGLLSTVATLNKALNREFKEETGIDVYTSSMKTLFAWNSVVQGKTGTRENVMLIFSCYVESEKGNLKFEIQDTDEIADAQYIEMVDFWKDVKYNKTKESFPCLDTLVEHWLEQQLKEGRLDNIYWDFVVPYATDKQIKDRLLFAMLFLRLERQDTNSISGADIQDEKLRYYKMCQDAHVEYAFISSTIFDRVKVSVV